MSRVLVVDDERAIRFTLRSALEDAGYQVDEATDGEAALASLERLPADLVITDLRMPRMDGFELLRALRSQDKPPKVVVITAHGSEAAAVQAMKDGAYDYFRKPFELDELLAVVARAVDAGRLQADNERLEGELNLSRSMVFAAPAMTRLAVLVQRLGSREVTVLLTGESGTGKERVAEALVRASTRRDRPFVRFNCASLSPELAEAELFGHGRGAFTGAHRDRPGLFREADGGTILLDEVGELALEVQARLLRVLQDGEVRPVGADRPSQVDVRIIAATHRDLATLVAQGRFRQDLFYRLDVVHLHVPPLRERPEDIPVLAQHFLRLFAERYGVGGLHLSPELLDRLSRMPWPGNVREIQNTVERMVALSHNGRLDADLLPDAPSLPVGLTLRESVEAHERGVIVEALQRCRGNRTEAAKRLGVSRVTLYEKIKKYGLS